MTHRTQRLLSAAGISLLFAAVITDALLTRVEDIDDTPMSTALPGWHAYPVPLFETAGPPPPVYVIWLRPDRMLEFLQYPELRIYFSAYEGSAQLRTGTIEVLGTECVYETPAGTDLDDSSLVRFVQRPGCNPLRGAPTGDAKLVVRLAERHRIGVGALVPIAPQADQGPDSIRVVGTPGAGKETFPVLRGYFVEYLAPTSTRRADLLAYMWQIQPGNWIWYAVGALSILLFLGASVTPHDSSGGLHSRWLFALRASLGVGCAGAALGLAYAVIVPPFQAADEPTHFLGFAEFTKRPDIIRDTNAFSRNNHFERLRFHPDERFRPIDTTRPIDHFWKESPQPVVDRSSNVRLWSLAVPYIQHLSPVQMLLALRVLNVLLFAAALAFGTAAMVLFTDVPFPQLAAFAFLFVPSLPFFATYVSNYASLTSAYIIFSFGVLVTIFGGRHGGYAGVLLGLGASLIFVLSRSALPMAAMLTAVLAGRLAIGQSDTLSVSVFDATRRALIFWVGLAAAGLWTATVLITPAYQAELLRLAKEAYPAESASAEAWTGRHLLVALGGAAALAAAIEVMLHGLRRVAFHRLEKPVGTLARIGSTVGAVTIALLMVIPLFVDFPVLAEFDVYHRPPVGEYVSEVARSALGIFRLQGPDFLMSTSFWVGFGWLDAIPPEWFTVTLTTLTAFALIGLLVHFASRRNAWGFAWLVTMGTGWVATLALYAIGTLKYSPNLHGRYLLGLYLSVLPLCWSLLMLSGPARHFKPPISRWTLCFAVCLMGHAYSLSFILRRYF